MKAQDHYEISYPELNRTLYGQIIPSGRKSISIQVTANREILIRVPKWITYQQLDSLLSEKKEWILRHYEAIPAPKELSIWEHNQLTALEKRYKKAAKEYIPERVAYFHQFTGGSFDKIVIRDQKTRWGSCSSNKTLSFNYRLMLAPPQILDYVVVHELCHLKHMNHSPELWAAVEKILPDYKERRKWLKEHGCELTMEHHLFPDADKG